MRYINIIILGVLLSLTSCEKDVVVQPKEYPYVITYSPSVNNEIVELSANITDLGNQTILKYGFVWSIEFNPTIQHSSILFDEKASKGVYSYIVKGGLIKGEPYYVRSYILTDQCEVYGNEVSFISEGSLPPVINGFEPKFGATGSQVVIEGRNFGLSKLANTVKFGENIALVDSVTETKLFVKVPQVTNPGKVVVSVETAGMITQSNDKFDLYSTWKKLNATHNIKLASASFTIADNAYVIISNTNQYMIFNSLLNNWQILTLPEKAGAAPKAFSTSGKGYALLENGFYEFDPNSNKWTRKKDFPDKVISNDYTFAMGFAQLGFIGSCYWSQKLWMYDPNSDTWTRKADFPEDFISPRDPVFGNCSFSIDNSGYLVLSQAGNGIYLWEYKVDSDVWEVKAPLSSNVYRNYACMVIDESAYIGLGENIVWGNHSNKFWKYDLLKNNWIECQNSPINMEAYASFGINRKGYVFSGSKVDSGSIWEFNPSRN